MIEIIEIMEPIIRAKLLKPIVVGSIPVLSTI